MRQARRTQRSPEGSDARRAELDAAVAGLDAPLGIVDLTAFWSNADDLVRRAGGLPIRVASKSVRIRRLILDVLERPGFRGVLAFGLAEASWLAGRGVGDVLVGYPTADRQALARLGGDEALANAVTLTVDDAEQLDLIESAIGPDGPPVRICLDIDTSWRPFGLWIGVRRSPIRTPAAAEGLVREVLRRPRFRLVGVLAYEAQVAGVPDADPVVRWMKRRSMAEIASRRAEVVAAVRALADLEFVNAGGTGNLEVSGADPSVTELTAGSGLYGPALFDDYRGFQPEPAALLAFPVVRRPAPGTVTVYSAGWIASGPAGKNRAPTPYLPGGLRLTGTEGAGEVQTPLVGATADRLRIGESVWFRHAKAGEPFEHLEHAHLVRAGRLEETVPTYRGEGMAFGV